ATGPGERGSMHPSAPRGTEDPQRAEPDAADEGEEQEAEPSLTLLPYRTSRHRNARARRRGGLTGLLDSRRNGPSNTKRIGGLEEDPEDETEDEVPHSDRGEQVRRLLRGQLEMRKVRGANLDNGRGRHDDSDPDCAY